MTTENGITSELVVEFEKVISELLIKMEDYARANDDGARTQAQKALENVYTLFQNVMARASYIQETIRIMHEIKKEIFTK